MVKSKGSDIDSSEGVVMTFRNLSTKMYLPDLDHEILRLWKEKDVFKRSVESKSTDDNYIFYDGPPFATGFHPAG